MPLLRGCVGGGNACGVPRRGSEAVAVSGPGVLVRLVTIVSAGRHIRGSGRDAHPTAEAPAPHPHMSP